MFMKLKMRDQFIVLWLFIAIITFVFGVFSLYSLSEANDRVDQSLGLSSTLIDAIDSTRSAQVDFKKQVQEWKDLLMRGDDPATFKKYLDAFNDDEARVKEELSKLAGLMAKLGINQEKLKETTKVHSELGAKYMEALKSYKSGDPQSAHSVDQLVMGIDRAPTDSMDSLVKSVRDDGDAALKSAKEAAARAYAGQRVSTFGFILFASIGIAGIMFYMLRGLSSKIEGVSKIITRVTGGARGQLNELEQVTLAQAESVKAIDMVTEHIRNARSKADTTNVLVFKGQAAIAQLQSVVEAIIQNSKKINQFTEVITQISNRTHILSLNAAIESARAGEHGKGFMVVAQEVGKLAENAALNASQISDIVKKATEIASEGNLATSTVHNCMVSIQDEAKTTSQMVSSVSVAMDEQQSSLRQIEKNIAKVRTIASGNSIAAEQMSATMTQLTHGGSELRIPIALSDSAAAEQVSATMA
jgi:methyl-accepting chemotaxis protein-like sensor